MRNCHSCRTKNRSQTTIRFENLLDIQGKKGDTEIYYSFHIEGSLTQTKTDLSLIVPSTAFNPRIITFFFTIMVLWFLCLFVIFLFFFCFCQSSEFAFFCCAGDCACCIVALHQRQEYGICHECNNNRKHIRVMCTLVHCTLYIDGLYKLRVSYTGPIVTQPIGQPLEIYLLLFLLLLSWLHEYNVCHLERWTMDIEYQSVKRDIMTYRCAKRSIDSERWNSQFVVSPPMSFVHMFHSTARMCVCARKTLLKDSRRCTTSKQKGQQTTTDTQW